MSILKQITHRGLNRHRLESNPKEKVFADIWEKAAPHTLGWLLSGNGQDVDFSHRDAEVAATMIQWLGSPVGQSFLYEVEIQREINRGC